MPTYAHTQGPAATGGTGPDPERLAFLKLEWEKYQREKRLKSTSQRDLIVDEFLRCPDHISIEDLLTRVRARNGRIGYATVYRTIKLLADADLATERHFKDGHTSYEVAGPNSQHHDHLICLKCHLILEFSNDEIEALQERVARDLGGFKVMQHKMELYALCPKEQGVAQGACANDERLVSLRPSKPGDGRAGHAASKPANKSPSAVPSQDPRSAAGQAPDKAKSSRSHGRT
ncbi:MAG: transcriptional repressor [Myxococcales bacterium]|nr:transcriptional repressor [Myxococcales bacterium]